MNKRKITIASVILLSLIIPPYTLVSANSNTTIQSLQDSSSTLQVSITKDQAINTVRTMIQSLQDASVAYAELKQIDTDLSTEGLPVWEILWRVENSTGNVNEFIVQLNANSGELISYYSFLSDMDDSYYPPKLTVEEAKKVAMAFVSKAIHPLSIDDRHIVEQNGQPAYGLFGPIQYSYNFYLKRNGIPSEDSVFITMDSNGNVLQYNAAIDRTAYPQGIPAITLTEARKKFEQQFELELMYYPMKDDDGAVQNWMASWIHSTIDLSDRCSYRQEIGLFRATRRINNFGSISLPMTNNLFQARTEHTQMTSKEAVQFINKIAVIPSGHTLSSRTMDKDSMDPNRTVWRLTWQDRQSDAMLDDPPETTAIIDARTGQLLEYRMDGYGFDGVMKVLPKPAKGQTSLTETAARQRAYELMNQLYPDASSRLKLLEYEGEDHYDKNDERYVYRFGTYVNDISVINSTTTLSFDKYGRLLHYKAERTATLDKIPLKSNITVMKEAALNRYLDQHTLELRYFRTVGYISSDWEYVDPKIMLVYEPLPKEPSHYKVLDAETGEWATIFGIAETGTETVGMPKPIDIEGHLAEEALNELLRHQVIEVDEQGHVNPDEPITALDWLSMMVKATAPDYLDNSSYMYSPDQDKIPSAIAGVRPDSEHYPVVHYAANEGWIDWGYKIVSADKLTREQLAVMLTSIVNYDKLTSFLSDDIAVNQFSDASSITNRGAVALCVKLGLLHGKNGQFNPKGHVTKAEAATVIMELVKLQGRLDREIAQ